LQTLPKAPALFYSPIMELILTRTEKAFSRFITNAQKRFPASHNIQVLTKEALDYISIYEEELNVGDKMPELNLEDINGSELSASSAGGKYTFIDLWSTWCASCVNYMPVKKDAAKKFSSETNWR
jgi:thiol-disulfide isomerase/thioredoxin